MMGDGVACAALVLLLRMMGGGGACAALVPPITGSIKIMKGEAITCGCACAALSPSPDESVAGWVRLRRLSTNHRFAIVIVGAGAVDDGWWGRLRRPGARAADDGWWGRLRRPGALAADDGWWGRLRRPGAPLQAYIK